MLTTIAGMALIGWMVRLLAGGIFTGAMAAPRLPEVVRAEAPGRFWAYAAINVAFFVAGIALVCIERMA